MGSRGVLRAFLAVALVASSAGIVRGIVIRHDRPDERYRELARDYPAAVTVLPDGAGVLVGRDWVLTAAHVAVAVAEEDPRVEVAGREIVVDRIANHPKWKEGGAHDIAMLHLAEPVRDVTPVGLWSGRDEVGREVVFVGRGDFGDGNSGPREADGVRRAATNTVVAADADWVHFVFDEPGKATELEGVSGPGDSGGPALVDYDGRLYTLGVSAGADGPDGPGRYGVREVYTRVSTHLDWILAVMSGKYDGETLTPARP